MKAFLLVILLSLAHSAFAVIGETEAETKTRYGAPLLPPEFLGPIKTLVYQDGPVVVVAKFERGICSAAGFSRMDRASLSAEEIFNLLEANDGGQRWGTPPESLAPGVLEWRSRDKRTRVAVYRMRECALFISTQAFLDRAKELQREIIGALEKR